MASPNVTSTLFGRAHRIYASTQLHTIDDIRRRCVWAIFCLCNDWTHHHEVPNGHVSPACGSTSGRSIQLGLGHDHCSCHKSSTGSGSDVDFTVRVKVAAEIKIHKTREIEVDFPHTYLLHMHH